MDMLNLTAGMTNASGTPLQTNDALPQENAAAPAESGGFGDALLNVISTLLAEQGQVLPRPNVSADVASLKDKDDEKDEPQTTPLPLRDDAPQQLLEALLMSSQMPVKAPQEPLMAMGNAAPTLSLSPVSPAITGIAPGVNPMMPATAAVLPHAVQSDEPALTLPKEMQPIAPQVLTTLAAVSAAPMTTNVAPSSSSLNATNLNPTVMQHAPVQVDLEDSRWSQQLQSALGDRLQVQVKNQIQHATIRLDPPEMGKIDIALQVDNGRVQVQINASHAEVYRALQQTSNDLRQSLTEQNFIQVNVQVSSQSGGQQQGKGQAFSHQQSAAILAGNEFAGQEHDAQRRHDDSVLLTV
ncbi:flagellar hook-length control protein FliK [Enterobacteriaceae bacterium 89]|nr:flagellar hook-length control protein FliK [Enterobacteriaceae bacterium 89]